MKRKGKDPLKETPCQPRRRKLEQREQGNSENEISPLNSTVQIDETDFDEPGDEQESISFNISYDNAQLQSIEPEVNETEKNDEKLRE